MFNSAPEVFSEPLLIIPHGISCFSGHLAGRCALMGAYQIEYCTWGAAACRQTGNDQSLSATLTLRLSSRWFHAVVEFQAQLMCPLRDVVAASANE